MIKQEDLLKQMNPVKRLEQAFALSDFTLKLARNNIRQTLGKNASPERITLALKKRLYGES